MKFIIRSGSAATGTPIEATHTLGDVFRIGSHADNDFVIDSPKVAAHHIELEATPEGVRVRALTRVGVRVNGLDVKQTLLQVGDQLEFGAYALRVLPVDTPDTFLADCQPVADAMALQSQAAKRRLIEWGNDGQHHVHLRPVAWGAVILTLLLLLLLPLASIYSPDIDRLLNRGGPLAKSLSADSWSVGPISRYHIRIELDCATCHNGGAFSDIPDTACEKCHDNTHGHLDATRRSALQTPMPKCGECHQEHIGDAYVVLGDRIEQCTQCHSDIKKTYSKTELRDIPPQFGHESLFGGQHPQFKASLIDNPGQEPLTYHRVSLDDTPQLREYSGLRKFSHRDHMAKEGVLAPDGKGGANVMKLECWSCHVPDSKGEGMKTASFDENCHRCHKLTFDKMSPDTELPHGKPEKLSEFLKAFYAASPKGALMDPPEPTGKKERELPGQLISQGTPDLAASGMSLDGFVDSMGKRIFDQGVCSECHEVVKKGESFDHWQIVKPSLATRWFPAAKFPHKAHDIYGCTSCHAVERSESPEDVNLPGRDNCVECHSSENTPCLKCHTFHQEATTQMNGKPILPPQETLKPWHGHAVPLETEHRE